MKLLLLDNNLSRKLAVQLHDVFPDITHVSRFGLETKSDLDIWNFASQQSGTIITKDNDYNHLLNRFGHPPKVIWIRTGNTTTQKIAHLLLSKVKEIKEFIDDRSLGLLLLY